MILVTLGTQDKSFERLLIEIERLIDKKIIQEEVIVQAGYTKYSSNKMKIFDYLPKDEFEKLIDKCNVLITHGGVGSIFDSVSREKRVIAIPRLSKYKEHVNDHQIQVVEEFGKEGYILPCLEISNLEKTLKKIKSFHPKVYKRDNKKMCTIIEKYIKEESKKTFSKTILQYFSFGILFLILQLIFFNYKKTTNLGVHFILWITSYVITILMYSLKNHNARKVSRKLCIFSFCCFLVHFLVFLILFNITSILNTVIFSNISTLLIGYFIYMLIFGGRNLLND